MRRIAAFSSAGFRVSATSHRGFSYALLFARSAKTANAIATPASAIAKGLSSNQKATAEPIPHNPPTARPCL
ncbi:hypothetical protein BDI4_660074 [Burkholderia diffusa]|nr:hypothetical protein BDI4_660074 [Burkholderia diffusa]